MGREQPHEVLQEEMRSPVSGEEKALDQYTLEANQLKSSSVKNLRLLEDSQLTTSQQCTLMVKKANSSLGCVLSGADSRSREVTPSLGTAETRQVQSTRVSAGLPSTGEVAEPAQHQTAEMMTGLGHQMHWEGLRELGVLRQNQALMQIAQMSNISAMFSQFRTT